MFKNVVHSLAPRETPCNSASHKAKKLCAAAFLNIAKYLKTVRCGYVAVVFIFSIYLKPVLYLALSIDVRIHVLCMYPYIHVFVSLMN